MKTSHEWLTHFRQNALIKRIDWSNTPSITSNEKKKIIRSLKAWQLGETSDGYTLLRASEKYAAKFNDPQHMETVQLFIHEENKHGESLGRYLDLLNVKRLQKNWGDTMFRKVRRFNTNIELWTITVLIIESFAQVFYKAISDATNCTLLKQICDDTLKDEVHHVQFQLDKLCIVNRPKSFLSLQISLLFYDVLYHGILATIWIAHGKAFRAGGATFKITQQFMNKRMQFIYATISAYHQAENQLAIHNHK